uniref:Transmembrane protein n=1 Tax=Globisporangium ultimum (strain ATCC 200006 / CBS 805.95 / DAOM BR144) TaxID=431595 RepID=K3XAH2_GLOUD
MAFSDPASYQAVLTPHQGSSSSGRLQPPMVRRRRLEIDVVENAVKGPVWKYPGGGSAHHVHVPENELHAIEERLSKPKHLLGEWPSTAICGNDILSSVLYSASSVSLKAGKLMPVPLLLVAVVLYFFRFIYEEVVTAIPLNGGSYNGLLNTTSKRTASVAACLGILSYVATGVVSSTSGVNYLRQQVDIPLVGSVVALLFAFAVLAFMGITESSRVAMAMFFHHVLVLSFNTRTCSRDNMHSEFPEVDFASSMLHGNVFTSIFFGFGASMLGITGFETSAQFVEEQVPGVFRKTLRNMWGFASFFNFTLAIGILAALPMEEIYASSEALLAQTAFVTAGKWLEVWVCIDAFVVLAGAVLTSYVGICGLVRRLSNDRVLPAFLAKTNKLRGTTHYIIFSYFLLSSSLVIVLNGDATVLNGVYTYAFLGLMALFACGCMLLKGKRAEMPRDVHASWASVVCGFLMIVIAILANLLGDPKVLMYFAMYFIIMALVVFVMLERVTILECILGIMKKVAPSKSTKLAGTELTMPHNHTGARGGQTIARAIVEINQTPIIFFAKNPDLTILNKAVVYVRNNEQTHNLRIIHVYGDEEADASVLAAFEQTIALLDHMYPKLRIDFVSVEGEFTPAIVEWIAESMKVPKNMMFIKQPSNFAAHKVSTSGIRVITA